MGAATLGLAFAPHSAEAIPSFARQTGQPCASCHTAFPELTPSVAASSSAAIRWAAACRSKRRRRSPQMLLPTFTKTKVQQDSPPTNPDGYPIAHTNDNFVMQQVSLLLWRPDLRQSRRLRAGNL